MSTLEAVHVAIDLIHVPSRVRRQKSLPLPDGTTIVLRIAAGDESALSEASNAVDRPPALLHNAAAFFIEQILLCPDADSYRVLGASTDATGGELRRNMALLLKWVHPDVNQQSDRSIFARRVTQAWENVKTPERRAAYDTASRAQDVAPRVRNRPDGGRRFQRYASRRHSGLWESEHQGLLRRAMSLLLGGKRPRRR
jgi:hypothetical protein